MASYKDGVKPEDVRSNAMSKIRGVIDEELIAKINSVTSAVQPHVNQYDQVEVSIDPAESLVFCEFVLKSFDAMSAAMENGGGKLGFSLVEYASYLLTIVYARCEYVRTGRAVIRPQDDVPVPAFINLVINQIGFCTNDELGVHLRPTYVTTLKQFKVPEERLLFSLFADHDSWQPSVDFNSMSRNQIDTFALKLRNLRKFGFIFSDNPFSREREGDWEFMALQVMDNSVMAVGDNATPVHAMLASVLSLKQLQSVMLPRVNYGPLTYFKSLISAVAGPA